jgi:hypothetical protein
MADIQDTRKCKVAGNASSSKEGAARLRLGGFITSIASKRLRVYGSDDR